ncbi:unnamed protein product [Penicillium salamii]|nr:unnamed protein product [Penicillium salamii]
MFLIRDQLQSGNQVTPGNALPTNRCFGHHVDTTTGLKHHSFDRLIGLCTVVEATNQHLQCSWELALILVICENWIVDISLTVDTHLKAHDCPMVDATMPFCSNNLLVQHHYQQNQKIFIMDYKLPQASKRSNTPDTEQHNGLTWQTAIEVATSAGSSRNYMMSPNTIKVENQDLSLLNVRKRIQGHLQLVAQMHRKRTIIFVIISRKLVGDIIQYLQMLSDCILISDIISSTEWATIHLAMQLL